MHINTIKKADRQSDLLNARENKDDGIGWNEFHVILFNF